MIIDANNLIVGRMATVAAKRALLGENVEVVNCENTYISGGQYAVIKEYKVKRSRGSIRKGPFFPRMPDRVVKRIIRGMLPRKTDRGRNALKRVKCYMGVPEGFDPKKFETIKEADVSKLPSLRYVQMKRVCKELGARK
ncbi:50S ribosomal protein L13 [Candidatus Woesearchaeota archaeon]|nr:50S ribosomal protein L13 [Candidatus Woesearchaeota archaeon]